MARRRYCTVPAPGDALVGTSVLRRFLFLLAALVPVVAAAAGGKADPGDVNSVGSPVGAAAASAAAAVPCSRGCEAEFVGSCVPYHKETLKGSVTAAVDKCTAEMASGKGPLKDYCKKGCALTQAMQDGVLGSGGPVDSARVADLNNFNFNTSVRACCH